MKHFRLKICILSLLTVILIMGAFMLMYGKNDGTYLSDNDINAVISLLESKNISIDREIIPRKTKTMPKATASSEFKSSEDIAKVLFQNGFVSYNGVCEKNGVTIRLTPEILIKCNVPMLGKDFKNTTTKNAAKKVRKLLDKYEIDISDSVIEVYESGEKLSVVVTQSYGGFSVFNNSLVFDVSDKGVRSVKGMYFAVNESGKEKMSVNSAADALIKFAMDPDNRGVNITGIEQGYRIEANERNMHSTDLIPTWSILTNTGKEYYINAS